MYPEPTGEVRMSLSLRFAAGSHKGMIREGNEDSGYAGPRLLAIADGMGGQAAGEVASSEVISTLVTLDDDVPGSDILTSLGEAVQRANEQLRVMVEEDPQLEGMGTTLTALLWTGQRLGLVHVGDSRALPAARRRAHARSPRTTPGCSGWSTRAGSPRRRPAPTRSARC